MKISDLLSMCLRNLARRRFRTFLTVTGVVIGTCAIVIMISLGIGVSDSQQKMLEQWGDLTMIEINNYGNNETPLDDAALDSIRMIPGVDVATPIMQLRINTSTMIYAGRKNRYAWYAWNVMGMSTEALSKMGYSAAQGEMFGPYVSGKKIRVMMGDRTAYDFEDTKKRWPNNRIDYWSAEQSGELPDPFFPVLETPLIYEISPLREKAKPIIYDLEVVGVFKGDYRRGYETIYGVVMDIEDMKRIQTEFDKANNIKKEKDAAAGYESAKVKCVSINDVAAVETAIKDMGFVNVYSMEAERQSMQESSRQIQLILGILGGVSLFVAALSITNTMIMSVYERTREIGVMKVLGCVLSNIRAIFLIEAALIGFWGGVIGNVLSYFASYLLNTYGGRLGEALGMSSSGGYMGAEEVVTKLSIIPPWLMLLGLAFATLIGLVSGIAPAMRAVRISALEAIRTE